MILENFFSGFELNAHEYFGVHIKDDGIIARVYAPNAKGVELITSKDNFEVFHCMEKIDNRGIYELELKDTKPIYSYRYRISTNKGYLYKSDPYAFYSELRPANASVMYDLDTYEFSDLDYMNKRNFSYENPLNIYELHLNGFKKDGELAKYTELKETLIPYVKQMGYTHIELMPVFEHPFDGSWGYQASGFFSATSRYGTPAELMDLINECHLNDIGVILDVAYVHFVTDEFSLGNFDGKPVYEYKDKSLMYSQWNSYQFDLGSGPVISYLMSSANFFLKKYHIDGLRLDAVSNLIYFDGNKQRGVNENGLSFIKRFNYHIKKENPNIILIAEDSTDYEKVTVPCEYNGLGFDYKWDLGWMNDTLSYYAMDPEYKKYHHNQLTFSMAYFYSEKFILPLSHDEVVHSKKTIVDKMWGDYETKFSLCRNLFLYMFTHPGKKLNFLGNDISMFREFDETKELDWFILKYPIHDAFNRFFRDICQIYKYHKAFNSGDYAFSTFKWIDADNYKQSIYVYTRSDDKHLFVIVLNMMPISYTGYRIGVPIKGEYVEMINTEKDIYNGCNMCNFKPIKSRKVKSHNLPNSICVDIAPYAGIIFSTPIVEKVDILENKTSKEIKIA